MRPQQQVQQRAIRLPACVMLHVKACESFHLQVATELQVAVASVLQMHATHVATRLPPPVNT